MAIVWFPCRWYFGHDGLAIEICNFGSHWQPTYWVVEVWGCVGFAITFRIQSEHLVFLVKVPTRALTLVLDSADSHKVRKSNKTFLPGDTQALNRKCTGGLNGGQTHYLAVVTFCEISCANSSSGCFLKWSHIKQLCKCKSFVRCHRVSTFLLVTVLHTPTSALGITT